MKKVVRLAVAAGVALVMVGGAVLLAANLYVQSPPAQQQIRQALAASLKMPAELTKTTVTPWEGLRIDGITVQPPAAPGAAAPPTNFLKAESFRVQFAFLPLFQRRFVVRQVLLDHPQLSLAQNAEGRWQFPPEQAKKAGKADKADKARPAQPAAVAPSSSSPPADTAAAPPPPDQSPAAPGDSAAPKEPAGFSVAVDKFKMRHGELSFLDHAAQTLGQFVDVNLDGRLTGPRKAAGALWFEQAVLPMAGLSLNKFHSRFEYDEDAGLSLSDGKGELAGGTVTVSYRIRTQEEGSPYAVRCGIDGAALEQLLPPSGGGGPMLRGRLQGSVEFKGMSDDANSRRGSGELSVRDAQFKNLPFLQMLGDALKINDLSHPQLKKAELRCRLEGPILYVEPITLEASDLQLSAQGTYHTVKNRLDLQARLTIDKAVSRQLPQFIEASFTPCGDEAPGCRYIDFPIKGPLNNPSTDLRERLLSGSLDSLLQKMTAPKPKNPNKKPKRDGGAPAPEAAASPAPAEAQ